MLSITEAVSPFSEKIQFHSFGKSQLARSEMTKEAVIRLGGGSAWSPRVQR